MRTIRGDSITQFAGHVGWLPRAAVILIPHDPGA
jgi:hypothetical protein